MTQIQYDVLKQTIRTLYIKVNLLNANFNVIGEITGNVVSGNTSISSTSNIRRTFDIDMVITDSSLDLQPGGKIWMYRIIQPMIGVKDIQSGDIIWYNQGMGIVDEPSWKFDNKTSTLSFSALDLICLFDGTYDGNLVFPGDFVVSAGENVRKAIIDSIEYFSENFKISTMVQECKNVDDSIVDVPNDLTFSQGSTLWDVLTSLRDILPNYQMYFDIDGVFHYEPVPYLENPYISLDDDMWDYAVISEDTSISLRDVYNHIVIYGRSHDVQYYLGQLEFASFPTGAGNYITAYNASSYNNLFSDGQLYGFVPAAVNNSSKTDYYLQVGDGDNEPLPIVTEEGTKPKLTIGEYYVLEYTEEYYNGSFNFFKFLGGYQAYGEASDTNKDSPFSIQTLGVSKTKVLTGGDYDYIYSDSLAQERAEWEIYRNSRTYDTIKLSCVPIYFLDVNTIVEYTSKRTGEKAQYLVQAVSTDWSHEGTMSVTLQKYYPYYN
jgi:hypothetical protein